MYRLGQVSLTKPTYRRIVLRCCSVPQAKPSPDYEYRISLRPHPVGHPSSSTRDSASRAVPSSIRVRRDGYREAGEWQQAGGDQRDHAAQKVFARAGSRKLRNDQHQECSTTDNHGYRWLGRPDSDTENRRRSGTRPRTPDKEVPDRCGRVPPVGTKTCRPPLDRRGPVEAERLQPADPQLVIDELRKIAGHARHSRYHSVAGGCSPSAISAFVAALRQRCSYAIRQRYSFMWTRAPSIRSRVSSGRMR
jgi:hypothetical protein